VDVCKESSIKLARSGRGARFSVRPTRTKIYKGGSPDLQVPEGTGVRAGEAFAVRC